MIRSSMKCLLILLSAVPLVLSAQTHTNEQYGYSIELDDRYQLAMDTDVSFFRSDNSGVVIIRSWPDLSEEIARDYLERGYQDEKVALVIAGKPVPVSVENGKGLQVDIDGIVERKRIKGVAGSYYGDAGQGLLVLVAAELQDWDQVSKEAETMLASIKLGETIERFTARDWWFMLANTQLVRRDTTNGELLHEDLEFCGDGVFYHSAVYTSNEIDGSGSFMDFSRKQKSGRWYVTDDEANKVVLALHYRNGREDHKTIEDRMGRTYLDGQRYFILRNDRCR